MASSSTPANSRRGDREATDHPLLLVGALNSSDARHRHIDNSEPEVKLVDSREGSEAYRRELHDGGVSGRGGRGDSDSAGSNA